MAEIVNRGEQGREDWEQETAAKTFVMFSWLVGFEA